MIKLQIRGEEEPSKKNKTFHLVQDGNTVTVQDEEGWNVVTILVKDGDDIVLYREPHLPTTEGYAVDEERKIVEVKNWPRD